MATSADAPFPALDVGSRTELLEVRRARVSSVTLLPAGLGEHMKTLEELSGLACSLPSAGAGKGLLSSDEDSQIAENFGQAGKDAGLKNRAACAHDLALTHPALRCCGSQRSANGLPSRRANAAPSTSRYLIHRFRPWAVRRYQRPRGLNVRPRRSHHALASDLALFRLVRVSRNPDKHHRCGRFCSTDPTIETLPRDRVGASRAVCLAANSYLAF